MSTDKSPVKKPAKELADYFNSDNVKLEVAKVLPKHITPERVLRVALTSCLKSPQLAQAAAHPIGRASLFNALLTCSQAGLEVDGRNAHLVPFWSKDDACYKVQAIFDWKGLVALGLRGGMKHIYADLVCDNDSFRTWVEDGRKKLIHEIDWKVERGEPYLFYCVSINAQDVFDYEVMTMDQVLGIRDRSKAGKSGPWATDFLEMAKKTVIRRMSKRWDLLPEVQEAINADDDVIVTAAPKEPSRPLFGSRKPQELPEGSLDAPEGESPAPPESVPNSATPDGPDSELPDDPGTYPDEPPKGRGKK